MSEQSEREWWDGYREWLQARGPVPWWNIPAAVVAADRDDAEERRMQAQGWGPGAEMRAADWGAINDATAKRRR